MKSNTVSMRGSGKLVKSNTVSIRDSGKRTQFETGSLKEIVVGRGRYDLLPLSTLSRFTEYEEVSIVLAQIDKALHADSIDDKIDSLDSALRAMIKQFTGQPYIEGVIHDLAVLYEAGAIKYAERDWEKGRPMEVFIDSTLRHFFQALNGQTDEDHKTAAMWNLLGCIDTIIRLPEMAYTIKKVE